MTFKLLPAKYYLNDPDDFARHPIGSGPFAWSGVHKDPNSGLPMAVFRASPTYGRRLGKTGQPLIREIRFYSMEGRDARQDFKHDRQSATPPLHLLLDLPARKVAELKSQEAGLRVKVQLLPSGRGPGGSNRRVWFLAVNHRHPPLQNEPLRRALARAIDREAILNACFRDSQELAKPHQPLNGPYPAGSWACDPRVPASLFNPRLAKSDAALARAAGLKLQLKYPDEPEIFQACQMIQKQVQEQTKITLDLVPCSWHELRKAVEIDHQYQLAYFWWDHADESYPIWPMFDPNGAVPGGQNFLGRLEDAALSRLDDLFRQTLQHREFSKVQYLTQQVHRELFDRMPLIPLWQLDRYVAVHETLQLPVPLDRLDPQRIFSHVERWKLEK
jgi:ABC-type transport system substrate-binding protein